jgi:hypothetical protein
MYFYDLFLLEAVNQSSFFFVRFMIPAAEIKPFPLFTLFNELLLTLGEAFSGFFIQ